MHSLFRITVRPRPVANSRLAACPRIVARLVPAIRLAQAVRSFAKLATMDQVQIKVHNTLSPGAVVSLDPIKPGHISWYACGPTVFDLSHVRAPSPKLAEILPCPPSWWFPQTPGSLCARGRLHTHHPRGKRGRGVEEKPRKRSSMANAQC